MTTLAQLDKIAAKWFSDQMRRRGFAVEKKFLFWRKRGPLFDMLMSETLAGGDRLRVTLSIWSPWVDHPETGEFGAFPPDYALVGGGLSADFPARLASGELFPLETEQEAEESLKKILVLVDQIALPWFSTVNSYESYVAYIDRRGYLGTRERKEQIKLGIARAFEREPYL